MHTQNVNVNGATGTSRIWAENRIDLAINDQKNLLAYLIALKNKPLSENDEAEQVLGTLMQMADNVLFPGITDWNEYRPRVLFSVAQPWLQARVIAEQLFSDTGAAAWMAARVHIADCIEHERHS